LDNGGDGAAAHGNDAKRGRKRLLNLAHIETETKEGQDDEGGKKQMRKRHVIQQNKARVVPATPGKVVGGCTDDEFSDEGAQARITLRSGRTGGIKVSKTSGGQKMMDDGSDEEPTETQVKQWEQDLRSRCDPGSSDVRTAFSIKVCPPSMIRRLATECFLGCRRPEAGGCVLIDNERKINLHFLLSSWTSHQRIKVRASRGDRNINMLSEGDRAFLKWLVKLARRENLVSPQELKRGRIAAKRIEAIRKSGTFSMTLKKNLADNDADSGDEQLLQMAGSTSMLSEVKFPKRSDEAEEVAFDPAAAKRQLEKLRTLVDCRQHQASIASSVGNDIHTMRDKLLAPTLSFDWQDNANDSDNEESWGGLQVGIPSEEKCGDSKRDILINQLRKSVSFSQVDGLARNRRTSHTRLTGKTASGKLTRTGSKRDVAVEPRGSASPAQEQKAPKEASSSKSQASLAPERSSTNPDYAATQRSADGNPDYAPTQGTAMGSGDRPPTTDAGTIGDKQAGVSQVEEPLPTDSPPVAPQAECAHSDKADNEKPVQDCNPVVPAAAESDYVKLDAAPQCDAETTLPISQTAPQRDAEMTLPISQEWGEDMDITPTAMWGNVSHAIGINATARGPNEAVPRVGVAKDPVKISFEIRATEPLQQPVGAAPLAAAVATPRDYPEISPTEPFQCPEPHRGAHAAAPSEYPEISPTEPFKCPAPELGAHIEISPTVPFHFEEPHNTSKKATGQGGAQLEEISPTEPFHLSSAMPAGTAAGVDQASTASNSAAEHEVVKRQQGTTLRDVTPGPEISKRNLRVPPKSAIVDDVLSDDSDEELPFIADGECALDEQELKRLHQERLFLKQKRRAAQKEVLDQRRLFAKVERKLRKPMMDESTHSRFEAVLGGSRAGSLNSRRSSAGLRALLGSEQDDNALLSKVHSRGPAFLLNASGAKVK